MSHKPVTRREFLKAAGITLATTAVTCSGLGYAATIKPKIETSNISYGMENNMNKRILVTYATRAGSTSEVASAIGETLSQRGFVVDVKPVKENPSLNGYQAVIMGSAVRMGSWLPEAVEFVKTNQQALSKIPVAVFTVHLLNTGDDETSRVSRSAYLNTVRAFLNHAEEAFFAGEIDLEKLPFLDRLMAKMVKSPVSDLRDWDKIRGWANAALSQQLK
jgi:menaquinone-dependent protoporphyrinogen oxidase